MMHRVSKHGYKKPAAEPQPESQPVKGEYAESPAYAAKKAQETEQPQKQPQQEQPQQPNLLEKLRALGIEPDQVMAILSPLVETSVVQTLEKMQLGEAINKKMTEIETRLKATLEPTQQASSSLPPSDGNTQDTSGNTQDTKLRDTILTSIAQKLIGDGNSSGFEQMTKMLDMARAVSDAFNKPIMEAQAYTRREISDTLKMLRDAGATPNVARDTLIKRTEG